VVAMSIRSRSAKGELERMRKEMDRIWDRFSQEFSTSTSGQDWNPALDLTETENSLVVEIEIPGINPDNIDISITADVLTFTGEKKKEAEEKGKTYHLVERIYGKFSRSIRLPTTVNPDQVEARYKDGILRITLGKTEVAKSKRIEVKTT
jgi:HSP20 family protein